MLEIHNVPTIEKIRSGKAYPCTNYNNQSISKQLSSIHQSAKDYSTKYCAWCAIKLFTTKYTSKLISPAGDVRSIWTIREPTYKMN